MNNPKERILLIHLFSNGDCLFATTVAKQIKHDYPNCELSWAISTKCKSIIENNTDIDKIIPIEITDASQNDIVFENTISEANDKWKQGYYAHVFSSQIFGDNLAYYDGLVCTSIYKSFGREITVDTQPTINLLSNEIESVKSFANSNNLNIFKNVVLFECAPQSKQLNLTDEIIYDYCLRILKQKDTCVILSSGEKYNFNHPFIFDGSVLSIRETIALTNYCTILLGCSSGISWAATSTAAKELPTVQILDPTAYIFNPLSLTFNKLQKSTNKLIELTNFNADLIDSCFKDIFENGFPFARNLYNQKVKKQFKLHRGIVNNFLKEGKFKLLARFISINVKENGYDINMLKFILLGLVLFPIQFFLDKKTKQVTFI